MPDELPSRDCSTHAPDRPPLSRADKTSNDLAAGTRIPLYSDDWTDAAVRRWIRRITPELAPDLYDLGVADALGKGKDGTDVYLKDIWPTVQEIRDQMQTALQPEVFRKLYRDFAEQNPKWNEIPSSTGNVTV